MLLSLGTTSRAAQPVRRTIERWIIFSRSNSDEPLYWDRLRYQYRDITQERKPGEAFKDNYTYLPRW